MNNTMPIVLFIAVIVAVFIFGPILTIWSLNTLFPVLSIPYTIWTWLAAFLLFAGLSGLRVSKQK